MKRGDMFSRVMEEYGSEEVNMNEGRVADKKADDVVALAEVKKGTQKLMQDEERLTGTVPWSVYSNYIAYAEGWPIVPLFLLGIMSQGAQGGFIDDECQWPRCANCCLVTNTIVLGL